jgi:hypothetical protein
VKLTKSTKTLIFVKRQKPNRKDDCTTYPSTIRGHDQQRDQRCCSRCNEQSVALRARQELNNAQGDLVNAQNQIAALQGQLQAAQAVAAAAQAAAAQQPQVVRAPIQQPPPIQQPAPVQLAYSPGTAGAAAALLNYNTTSGAKIQKAAIEKLPVEFDLNKEHLYEFLEAFHTRAIACGWHDTLFIRTSSITMEH